MADEKLLEFDTQYNNFKKKLVAYFIAKKLTIEMLEKEFNELKPHISQYISLGEYSGLRQIMLDVIGAVIDEFPIRGGRIPSEEEVIRLLKEKEIRQFIIFLCPIYGVEPIRKELENNFFNQLYRIYIGNIPHPRDDGSEGPKYRKYMRVKGMYEKLIEPDILITINEWNSKMIILTDKTMNEGRTHEGKPLPNLGPDVRKKVVQLLGATTYGFRKSSRKSRKVRKSSRKSRKSRKSARKSRKSPRKSPRKSARKSRKSSRKSRR